MSACMQSWPRANAARMKPKLVSLSGESRSSGSITNTKRMAGCIRAQREASNDTPMRDADARRRCDACLPRWAKRVFGARAVRPSHAHGDEAPSVPNDFSVLAQCDCRMLAAMPLRVLVAALSRLSRALLLFLSLALSAAPVLGCAPPSITIAGSRATPASPAIAGSRANSGPSVNARAAALARTPAPAPSAAASVPVLETSPASPAPPVPRAVSQVAVVCDDEAAARVALEVLGNGGTAIDAAIAAMLALAVVAPDSTGLGGGGVALHFDAATRATAFLDFRESAPIGLRRAELARPIKNSLRGAFVGVPGVIAGIVELHRRFGKLPLADRFVAASDIAERGFVVSTHLARALAWNEAWVLSNREARAVFVAKDTLLHEGDRAHNRVLAATMRKLAPEPMTFYSGELADEMVATARRLGGRLSSADLAEYRAIERIPLRLAWAGSEIVTAPPPSAGGLLLLETLAMHTPAELRAHGYQSGAYLHVLAETFRGALADRVRFIGDPAFVKVDVPALLA
ncbi:MAG: hypothetical protein EXR75_08430, partial [Myxococcales bacterium]|nr:hypothetical protein [Myxococcales bacterium]